MPEKTVLIIGAGMAGLSAGCYAQRNGFRSRILEMHDKPGGLCTAWQRKGYTIEGCLHWLVGSGSRNAFHSMWQDLGALEGREFLYQPEYLRLEQREGEPLVFWSDLDRLGEELLQLAPEDRLPLGEFLSDCQALARMRIPVPDKPMDLIGPLEMVKLGVQAAPFLRLVGKWGKVSIDTFALRLRNSFLRDGFRQLWFPQSQIFFLMMTFAWLHNREAGYAIGGSLPLVEAIAARYRVLGGEIRTRARVAKILVQGDRAVGVRLDNGSEERADVVISAADGHATLFQMLEGRFLNDRLRKYYEVLEPFPPLVTLAFGVNDRLAELPQAVSGLCIPLDERLEVFGRSHVLLPIHAFNFDPTLAPPGKTVVVCILETQYEPWAVLHENPAAYRAEKERIAGEVLRALDRRLPRFSEKAEMTDVATPVTYVRYTGNWRGSFEGWLSTPGTWNLQLPQILPGLKNFYMAGQWVEPGGGLPTAASSGRAAIQRLCHEEKQPFR